MDKMNLVGKADKQLDLTGLEGADKFRLGRHSVKDRQRLKGSKIRAYTVVGCWFPELRTSFPGGIQNNR
jgi:hypothetical protein